MIRVRVRKHPLPARHLLPRLPRRPQSDRRPCRCCGHYDRAVSTRGAITYYGPAKCDHCGTLRPLRKAERPIDWAAVRLRYAIPRGTVVPQ